MARKSFVLLVVGTVIFILCSISSAGVPAMINYQGKLLTSGGALVNDTVQMTFSIYADTGGGFAQWTETQAQVIIKDGIFNVFLGSVNSIPDSIFDGSIKYFGVKVGSDPEMKPFKPMVSVPYAYRAGTANGGGGGGWVDDGTVVRLADRTDYVGIGTSNPSELLHVRTGAAAGDVIQIGDYTAIGEEYGSGATVIGDNAKPDDPPTEGMEIMATHGAYGARAIRMRGDEGITFHGQTGSVTAGAPFSSELMRITNTGNVGIGTTTPAEKLDVVGNIHASGSIVSGSSIGVVPANTPSGFPDRLAANGQVIYFNYEDPVNSGIGASTIGIARYGNTLNGIQTKTHINLGVTSITGFPVGDNVYCTVGGGNENKAYADRTTVGGGWGNMAYGNSSTVGGGLWNTADGDTAIVGGGSYNHASGASATIGGGHRNEASNTLATVGGGLSNTASGDTATVGGGAHNSANGTSATIGGGTRNDASNTLATVGGGLSNAASGDVATIGGGEFNTASNWCATVGGGGWNTASNSNATVAGGQSNTASNWCATVAGGVGNNASGFCANVGGGNGNLASATHSTIGGGYINSTPGDYATVGGGAYNTASGVNAVVPGGYSNTSAGDYSLAAGKQVTVDASADYTLAFGYNFTTYAPHAVIFHDSNTPIKVGIRVIAPTEALDVDGTARLRNMGSTTGTTVVVDGNGVLYRSSSSKKYKENIKRLEIAPEEVLKLQPVRFQWKTTGQEDIGLIAEDVEEVIPDLVIHDNEGKPDAVKYDRVAIYLLELVRAHQSKIDAQQEQIDLLKAEIQRMKSGGQ